MNMAARTKAVEQEAVEQAAVEQEIKQETAQIKKYIVESPVKGYQGIGAGGIHFAYGKAEVCEGWVLDWYKEHGYKVTEKK